VIRILKEMGIDKTRVEYWRKVVVRAKDSKDRREVGLLQIAGGRMSARCSARQAGRISTEDELIFFMPKFPPVLKGWNSSDPFLSNYFFVSSPFLEALNLYSS